MFTSLCLTPDSRYRLSKAPGRWAGDQKAHCHGDGRDAEGHATDEHHREGERLVYGSQGVAARRQQRVHGANRLALVSDGINGHSTYGRNQWSLDQCKAEPPKNSIRLCHRNRTVGSTHHCSLVGEG